MGTEGNTCPIFISGTGFRGFQPGAFQKNVFQMSFIRAIEENNSIPNQLMYPGISGSGGGYGPAAPMLDFKHPLAYIIYEYQQIITGDIRRSIKTSVGIEGLIHGKIKHNIIIKGNINRILQETSLVKGNVYKTIDAEVLIQGLIKRKLEKKILLSGDIQKIISETRDLTGNIDNKKLMYLLYELLLED